MSNQPTKWRSPAASGSIEMKSRTPPTNDSSQLAVTKIRSSGRPKAGTGDRRGRPVAGRLRRSTERPTGMRHLVRSGGICELAWRSPPNRVPVGVRRTGPDSSIYPWGNEWDPAKTNVTELDHLTEVGSYPDGRSWVGAFDMAGNAMEWVSDWMSFSYYTAEPATDPHGPEEGQRKIEKGGWWGSTPFVARLCLPPLRRPPVVPRPPHRPPNTHTDQLISPSTQPAARICKERMLEPSVDRPASHRREGVGGLDQWVFLPLHLPPTVRRSRARLSGGCKSASMVGIWACRFGGVLNASSRSEGGPNVNRPGIGDCSSP